MIRLTFAWDVITCLAIFVGGSCIFAPETVYRLTSKAVISVEPTNEPQSGIAEINWVPVDKATGLEP